MSNCCSTRKITKTNCPKCDETCKSISQSTVLQHLSYPFNFDVDTDDFFYCSNNLCNISYFSTSGSLFSTSQVRDKVALQQGWLCYCFDISQKQYQHALENNTASKIKNFVVAKTKAHQCACEIRNPSGQCCLADFKKNGKNIQ